MINYNSEYFMREAIRLSIENVDNGKGGPFAAVIVKEGKIIATGVNEVTSSNDPTAHAEVVAIRNACSKLNTYQLDGCEIYCSCEPCPMCLGAIYWARAAKIYFANTKEDAAAIDFDDDFIYKEIDRSHANRKVETVQLLRDEALAAFEKWRNNSGKKLY
ncbi:nucleoside deaminase [Lacibacter luteus]|nr:nucleoside deaminase [Lacibacter luteus]